MSPALSPEELLAAFLVQYLSHALVSMVVGESVGRTPIVKGDSMNPEQASAIAARFVHFLETGNPSSGPFTADVFCDFTLPRWRLQAQGLAEVVALRLHGHPGPGTVPRWRCDPTPSGLVLEVEERWSQDGKDWYCRELFRADVRGDSICSLAVYCTGDWDAAREAEHANAVQLLRP